MIMPARGRGRAPRAANGYRALEGAASVLRMCAVWRDGRCWVVSCSVEASCVECRGLRVRVGVEEWL